MTKILVFGDSLTYGAWDREGGWVARLRKFIDEKNLSDPDFYCLVYNLGIDGNCSGDLLRRFEFEAKQRLKEDEDEENILIFAIGENDSRFIPSKQMNETPIEKFRDNIQELIGIAQTFSSKIVFVGLIPIDEARTTPVPWNPDQFYKNEFVRKYDDILKSVCEEKGVYFIELFDKLKEMNYKDLLEEGLHPNSRGHEEIFKIVKEFLIKNRILTI